jgi:murein DD-endopeptidase MepM/ murein hydrolase activator NlpD
MTSMMKSNKKSLAKLSLLLGLSGTALTTLVISESISANTPSQYIDLPLPNPTADIVSLSALEELESNQPKFITKWVEVQNGDNLGVIMERIGAGFSTAQKIMASPNGEHFSKLRAGTHMEVQFNDQNQLVALHYHFSTINIVSAERTDSGFAVQKIIKPIESKIVSYTGSIDNSLYIDGKKAGMQVQQIMDMADIFAWDIDFGREIQPGTQFTAIFEVPFADGEVVGSGKLLGATINIDGNEHSAYWHREGGERAYFDGEGKSLRKAFTRNPVDYVRITSGFTNARFHPVLHSVRAHKGVDYGAPIGTPVHATGDGKITLKGWSNGYGNMVTIQHGATYSTAYGHLSKFGKYGAGQTVKQGDVIGYVGMTGLASGPHLHYEFRIKGQHVDPMGVKFTEATPIAAKEKNTFLKQVAHYRQAMNNPDTRLSQVMESLGQKVEDPAQQIARQVIDFE